VVGYLGGFWCIGTNFLDRITGFFYHEGTKTQGLLASLAVLASSVFKASFVTGACIRPLWLSHYSFALGWLKDGFC